MLYNIFVRLYVLLCIFAGEMAGIYIHIPFCKSRCIYCGFFSTTSLDRRERYVNALCDELKNRKSYIHERVDTIYFGGGTPSQLSLDDLRRILSHIYIIYNVYEDAEITVEGNPDDLTVDFLKGLRSIGVNRLSMGVQTFSDERLRFLNRRHSAAVAEQAVLNAQKAGFNNISIDLMFGFPKQTLEEWESDVKKALSLNVQHISAYSLMYEEGTLLGKMLDRGDVEEINEESSLAMYEHLMDALCDAGFEHYEISNFAKPGYRSKHNSSYWRGIPYLGVGAGAHSYDGTHRHFNPESLDDYLNGAALEEEELTNDMLYDEYVFTGLRTSDGINMAELAERFGKERCAYCLDNAKRHIDSGKLIYINNVLRLSKSGLFVSNDIMSDLMWVE